MSRFVLALLLLTAACGEGTVPQVATGITDDLATFECWMYVRRIRCVAPEMRNPDVVQWGELGGPGRTCSGYFLYPNGVCHDPTALHHCLRGIERQARTCDDPMPPSCAYVIRPC